MRSFLQRSFALVVLGATTACAPAAVAGQASGVATGGDTPAIGAVRAHLFQNKKGEWSENVLDPRYGGSWNSVAGANASNATLVVVEVTGPPGGTFTGFFGAETKYSVRLVAREKDRIVLDRTQTVPVLNDQGRASVAFLLYQQGCAPVQLTASIVGARAPAPTRRTLSFACGE